jgi:alpha-galactosidase
MHMPREAAYRQGLQAIREAAGDAYLVACGAPIIPSLGLCDALRVGPDAAADWESERNAVLLRNPAIPGARNAIRTTLNRLWLRPLVQPDPDVAYFRSVDCDLTSEQKRLLQALALVCGFKSTSDLPQWLSDEERERLRRFLQADPQITQLGRWKYRLGDEEIDFESAMVLPEPPTSWKAMQGAALGWLANHEWAMYLNHEIGKRALERKVRTLRPGR